MSDPKSTENKEETAPKSADAAKADADEQRISIYVYQSKTNLPNSIKSLIENCTKQKDAGTLGFEFQATESAGALTARLTSKGYGIGVLSVSDEREMQQAHLVLGKLSPAINKGFVRVLIVNKFNESKTIQNLKVRGAYEILEFGMNVKALTFKMNTAIKLTDQQYKRSLHAKAKTSSVQDSLKAGKKSRNDNACTTVYEASDNHAADFWGLSSESSVRYVMGRVVVEMIGPGPVAGHWTSTESNRNDEPGWMWNPRYSHDSPFFNAVPGGRWIFYGRQPDFSWQTNLWNFVSKSPYLAFHVNEGRDVQTVRFQKDGPSKFKVKKNTSDHAKWMALIKDTIEASMKQKDTLVAEKAVNDYRKKNEEVSGAGKDFIDKARGTGKLLEGKFKTDTEGLGADDFVDEAAESKELSIKLQEEKAREMRNGIKNANNTKPAFNGLKSVDNPESEIAHADDDDDAFEEPSGDERHGPTRGAAYGRPDRKKHAERKREKKENASHGNSNPENASDETFDEISNDGGIQKKERNTPKPFTSKKEQLNIEKKTSADAHDSHTPDSDEGDVQSDDPENREKTPATLGALGATGLAAAAPVDEAFLSPREALRAKRERAAEKAAENDVKISEKREKHRSELKAKIEEQGAAQAKKEEKKKETRNTQKEIQEKATQPSSENEGDLDQDASPEDAAVAAHAAREKKKAAESASRAQPGSVHSLSRADARADTRADPRAEDAEVLEDKSQEKNDPRREKPKTAPASVKPAFSVGDLSKETPKGIRERVSRSATFDVFLTSLKGKPLTNPILIDLIELDAKHVFVCAAGVSLSPGDAVQIRVQYECEPDSISFQTQNEVITVDPFEAETSLVQISIDPSTYERFDKILKALTTRRELMMDFFRMARGESKNEKAA